MSELKKLYEIIGTDDVKKEIYSSDQKAREQRSEKGQFSKTKGLFNFLQLIKDWESIVGPMMAQNTLPLKIKAKTLFISTKHAIFAQELAFLSPEILIKIKNKFPELEKNITQIKFSHSKYSAQLFNQSHNSRNSLSNQKKLTKKSIPHKFSPYYQARVQKAQHYFSHIEDPEIKKMLIDFMLSYE